MELLASGAPDWDEVASLVLRDPALLHAILDAAPLPTRQRLATTLRAEISQRLRILGSALVRAWLLPLARSASPAAGDNRQPGDDAVLVAECALHLAHETRYPYPDEAYLAGLWHRFGAGVAERCGLAGPLADALAFEHALDEAYLSAHPLVRLLRTARGLARDGWEAELVPLGRLCGLPPATLLSLRTDVAFLIHHSGAGALSAGEGKTALTVAETPCEAGPALDAIVSLARSALVQTAFLGLESPNVTERFALAIRMLCGEDSVIVIAPDDRGILGALPLAAGRDLAESYGELHPRLGDEASIIALAARTVSITSCLLRDSAPLRSAQDWHVVRWLGGDGIVCLPLRLKNAPGVAVIAARERAPRAAAVHSVLVELATAAGRALLDIRDQQAARAEAEARVAAHHREHVRRIAHEARNPLTVIKTYLGIIAQRHPEAVGLAGEMNALDSELDRITLLLRRIGEAPSAPGPETARCDVAELLDQLRALYEESLFDSHGVKFEVRVASGLPAAAIPSSALKQVLLNLFRNAAEALQPGGRFSVSVPGQVMTHRGPSLEIRLIDNGPGLPRDRLADLFSARPSAKGEGHDGVGLSIVRDIMQQWHGVILCRSQPGSGTSFQLLLPIAAAAG